jgi:hypothetical protein
MDEPIIAASALKHGVDEHDVLVGGDPRGVD